MAGATVRGESVRGTGGGGGVEAGDGDQPPNGALVPLPLVLVLPTRACAWCIGIEDEEVDVEREGCWWWV